jgi:ATP-dependent Clp protease adaptor protein ClpS
MDLKLALGPLDSLPFDLAQPKPGTQTGEDIDVKEKEEVATDIDEDTPWRLILYNDEVHTFEEVIQQLIKALKCSLMEAEELTLKVHSKGKATVFEGTFEECFQKNSVLQEIQLITEIKG